MPSARLPARLLLLALLALPLAAALAGCETLEKLNPFDEKKTPLAGDRKPVFTSGVPGVEYNAPPQQPSNSNVQLPPVSASENPDRPSAEPGSNPEAQSGQAAKKSARKPDSDDPWSGQR